MTDPKQKLLLSLAFLDDAFQTSLERVSIKDSATVGTVNASSLSLGGDGMAEFYRLPLLRLAGLDVKGGKAVDVGTFYRREEVTILWNKIDGLQGKNVLFVQGQPGTGKSTSVWRKVLEAAVAGDNILWISLDREGEPVSSVYFQGNNYATLDWELSTDLGVFLYNPTVIPLDTVVVDGCSTATREITTKVRKWATRPGTGENCRAIFTASTKVEMLRRHQHDDVFYHVVHSWTPDEYKRSLILNDNTTTPIFEACASLFYDEYGIDDTLLAENDVDEAKTNVDEEGDTNMDSIRANDASADDSMVQHEETISSASKKVKQLSKSEILDVLSSRYDYSGGSARWMFNYTKGEIERQLRTFCKNISYRQGILDGDIGPTSSAATNYFFGSSRTSRNGDESTEYFLVSKRAVEILTEEAGASSYEALYRFADSLENPSFEGWIVEADLFSQLESARKQSSDFNPRHITLYCAPFKPTEIHTWEHTKNKNRVQVLMSTTAKPKTKQAELTRMKTIASKLVPPTRDRSIVCKPTAWNQGGYDIFFVELASDVAKKINLRFGQVTKGTSHSLKAGYMFSVIDFFQRAGFEVESVEIAFLLTPKNVDTFALSEVEGIGFLKGHGLFGASPAKWQDARGIAKYELQLSRTNTAAHM